MKKIIVSAINLVEAGPLSVLQECLRYLSADLSDQYEIIALVNSKDLCLFKNIKYLEFPNSKKSWINRLYYEYYYFGKISRRLNPFLWLSLHDMTPIVSPKRQAVYCHNASPFYKLSFKEAIIDPKFALFNLLYRYLYSLNIKKNNFVIVQQNWLREEFKKTFGLKNVIVSYPLSKVDTQTKVCVEENNKNNIFFYPSLPRVFKNFEVICKAVEILNARGISDFKIYFTFNGSENKYAQLLVRKYKRLSQLHFLGVLPRQMVDDYYQKMDCLIFSSKLESWGLPITEFQSYGKPMLLSDLAFAQEAAGDYDKAAFFNPDDPQQLAKLMEDHINNKLVFAQPELKLPKPPFAENWEQLFKILLQ